LLEELRTLEAEIGLYKGITNTTKHKRPQSAVNYSREKKLKMEGFDFK